MISPELDQGFAEIMAAAQDQSPASKRLSVRFYVEAMEDEAASKASGRRVFKDTEMIEIRIPGSRDIIRRPAAQEDKVSYAALYLAFKQNHSQEAVEGFPLTEWAAVKRSQAEELRAAGIRTVEHLAAAPDSVLSQLGPIRSLQQKAKDWLAQQEGATEVNKLRSENDDLKARLSTLEEMVRIQSADIAEARQNGGALPPVAGADPAVAALKAQVEALVASLKAAPPNGTPKRRGRPLKAQPPEI
jgi:hypothetical protein